uniref:Uncharacterized protein n=1 Tax=Cucumis melo TaxID=3656 RepID=A0A9I9E2Y4_CUCME
VVVSQSEIPSISSSGSYKARAAIHDRFKQSNKTCIDEAKIEVARYLDEARIEDEILRFVNLVEVRNIYSIPISTVPFESAFSTGGRSKPLDDMTEQIDRAEEIDEGRNPAVMFFGQLFLCSLYAVLVAPGFWQSTAEWKTLFDPVRALIGQPKTDENAVDDSSSESQYFWHFTSQQQHQQ